MVSHARPSRHHESREDSMDFQYSTRSRFFKPIEDALQGLHGYLGTPVSVKLGPRGLQREVRVDIRADDPHEFHTDWDHPSWFSARITAAATVLQRLGFEGSFRVAHRDGILTITQV